MSRYNIIQAIFMSFYSKKLYRDVVTNWGGKTVLYLLFILFLSWIAFAVKFQAGMSVFATTDIDKIVAQVPVLAIKDGKISTPENHPYEVYAPNAKEKIAVIDTSGQVKTLEDAKAPILITDTQIITQTKPNEIKTNQVPNTLNMNIDPQVVSAYIKQYLPYIWIPFLFIIVLLSFIYRLVQALIYGAFGKLFSVIINAKITYGQCIQIVFVALTPAIIVASVLDYFNIVFPKQLLCYFALTILYLFFGIIANRNTTTTITSTPDNEK